MVFATSWQLPQSTPPANSHRADGARDVALTDGLRRRGQRRAVGILQLRSAARADEESERNAGKQGHRLLHGVFPENNPNQNTNTHEFAHHLRYTENIRGVRCASADIRGFQLRSRDWRVIGIGVVTSEDLAA